MIVPDHKFLLIADEKKKIGKSGDQTRQKRIETETRKTNKKDPEFLLITTGSLTP